MPGKLPLLFSEPFDAPIWQINSTDQLVVVTNRDQKKKQAFFSLFDLRKKAFLWKDIQFENDWLVSVLEMTEQKIIFQVVVEEDIERKTLFAFDIIKTKVDWVSEEIRSPMVVNNEIHARRISGEQISLNPATGAIQEIDNLIKNDISQRPEGPFHYTEGTKSFEQIQEFIRLKTGVSMMGACDYAEVGDKVIISFFGQQESGIFNEMLIVNRDGEILHEELISYSLSGVASDTFFIVGEALIFVKNRNALVGLLISE